MGTLLYEIETYMKSKKQPLTLLTNIREVMTLKEMFARNGRGMTQESDLSLIKQAAMVIEGDKIKWIGPKNKIPRDFKKIKVKEVVVNGNIYPGFIDCHTHTLFYGDRSQEFELKNRGVSYQEIAQKGGGITHTVNQTRAASLQELKGALESRLNCFWKQGVTTAEIKTGYGLSFESEMRMLKVLKSSQHPLEIIPTYLGAHALAPEFNDYKLYVEELKKNLQEIKKKKLTDRVDIFIEKGFFSKELAKDYLAFAKKMGFELTIHADQLSLCGGAELAVELNALSADHLICVKDEQIKKLASSQTTCVLLPAADFYSHCPYPPARKMLEGGCRVALASDFNPGTSPTQNIQFVGLLARVMMKMTLPEVFTALSLGGAFALGEESRIGSLTENKDADFFISDMDWDQFFYDLAPIPIKSIWKSGKNFNLKTN